MLQCAGLAWLVTLAVLHWTAGAASAVELRDAELVASGLPVLENDVGSVRLEDARLGHLGPPVVVPEPGALSQLGSGIVLLALLAARRRSHFTLEDIPMKKPFRLRALSFAILPICLAAPASAQVPQDMTYTGRLVDEGGSPLGGPVDLELRIFDSETGPTQLYREEHLSVSIDATGGFSVRLGQGTSPSGTFDAALFADVNRWMEVVVNTEVLTPRQLIGSVPWALVAEQANKIVPDPNAPRFEDCGNGTLADHDTGRQWEKKAGAIGTPVACSPFGCPDPNNVNNAYTWSATGAAPDGGVFTDFLAKLTDHTVGGAVTAFDVTGCFAGHCDWRLPNTAELQAIVDCSLGTPCVDPIFGPTQTGRYWSASTQAGPSPDWVWFASFDGGSPGVAQKSLNQFFVRAVRVGACD